MADVLSYIVKVRGGRVAKKEADRVAEGFDNITSSALTAQAATRGVNLHFGFLSGRMNTIIRLAAAFSPVLLAAGASLVSLGASAGAAAVGGGVVGAAGLTALIFGMGALIATVVPVVSGLKKVRTAQDAYNKTVAQYGRGSDEAMRAHAAFMAVVKTNGGQPVVAVSRAVDRLTKGFAAGTRQGRSFMLTVFFGALAAANRLLPAFTTQVNLMARALSRTTHGVFRQLSGPEMQASVTAFGTAFQRMIGPLGRGMTHFFFGLMRIFRAALPFVVEFARGFERTGHAFRKWSSEGGNVSRFVQTVVGHLKSWWGLTKALIGLTSALFGVSARDGRSLVDSLTKVVNRWTAWIRANPARVQRFFAASAQAMRDLAAVLGPLLKGLGILASSLMPAAHSGSGALATVLNVLVIRLNVFADILRFLGPAVGPIVTALIAWKLATMALTVATTALNIALRLTPLGMLVTGLTAVAAGFYLAYTRSETFRRIVDSTWSWIKAHWGLLATILIFPLRPILLLITNFKRLRAAAISVWNTLKSGASAAVHFVANRFRDLIAFFDRFIGKVTGLFGKIKGLPGGLLGKAKGLLPDFLGGGGVVTSGGAAVVGDRGPELLRVGGGRARVDPFPLSAGNARLRASASGGDGALGGTIVSHITLEPQPIVVSGREIARTQRREVMEAQARA